MYKEKKIQIKSSEFFLRHVDLHLFRQLKIIVANVSQPMILQKQNEKCIKYILEYKRNQIFTLQSFNDKCLVELFNTQDASKPG